MARFRGRQSGKHPIVSNKEIIDSVVLIVAGGVTTDVEIAVQINDYVGTVGTCPLGAHIKGFYLEWSTNNVDNIVGRTDWYLCKLPPGISITAFPSPGATGGNTQRRNIFHERKGIGVGAPTTAGGQSSRQTEFIAIPKGFQRMNENAKWVIRIGSSENYSFCLKVIYKWYI